MITNEENQEIKKILFVSTIESEIRGLDFQRKRIFEFSPTPNNDPESPKPTHDVDFYMIILRRLYRRIEAEQHDSRVANLKGKFNGIHKKIKIRDHFEHEIDFKTFPHITPGIMVACSVVLNQINPHIVSGNQIWFLNEDHEKFKKLMKEFANLYPFSLKPMKKVPLVCRILKKFTNRYCNK